jgi:hypothetical protein
LDIVLSRPLAHLVLKNPVVLSVVASATADICESALAAAPGVTVPTRIVERLQRIATAFCLAQTEAGRAPTKVVVTSGMRTTADEANELQKRLSAGRDLAHYENQEAIKEVRDAFAKSESLKLLLDNQVARGCFVSKHLVDRAADIQNSDMNILSRAVFKKIAEEQGALVIEDEGGTRNHFHLNFPPYPGDPKRCAKGR